MGKTIQGWTRMENPNLSADLVPSPSSSLHTNHPPSSLHPSTPASLPTRATCALRSACRTTPSPCPRTRLHPFCLPCARAQDSTSPPSWPTLQATKSCRHRLRPNLRHAACCAPVSLLELLLLQKWSKTNSTYEVFSVSKKDLSFAFSASSEITPPVLPLISDATPVSLEPYVQSPKQASQVIKRLLTSAQLWTLCVFVLFLLVQAYQHRAEVPGRNSRVARSTFLPVWPAQGRPGLGPRGWLPPQTGWSRAELVSHVTCHPLTVVTLLFVWAFCHHIFPANSFKLFFSGGFDDDGLFQCAPRRRNQPGAGFTLFTWTWRWFPCEYSDL